jgi:hypothetical protein
MSLYLPVNVWTVGLLLTIAVFVWAWNSARQSYGDYNFWPALVGMGAFVTVAAFWLAVILSKVLK